MTTAATLIVPPCLRLLHGRTHTHARVRYVPVTSQSALTTRKTLFYHRVRALERRVLAAWPRFTIWGAGRDGKTFFNALASEYQGRVTAFCDVDPGKVGNVYHNSLTGGPRVPIVHFRDATKPLILCVALNRTDGEFEANVRSLGLVEGVDYWQFA